MRTKLALFTFAIGSFTQSALYADSVVCRAGDQLAVVSCDTLTGISNVSNLYSVGHAISGNTVTGEAEINVGANYTTEVEQAVVSLNDTFSLPKSPLGDVYKITASGNIVSREEGEDQVSTSGSMTVGQVFSYQALNGNCEFGSCVVHETIPADQAHTIGFQGSGSITVAPQGQYGVEGSGMSEFLTLERFKADGVTPDAFTPEPASLGLALGGFMALGVTGFRKRRKPF